MINTLAAQARDTHGTSYLLGCENTRLRRQSVLSPFFQLKPRPVTDVYLNGRMWVMPTSRNIRISDIKFMAKRAIIGGTSGNFPKIQVDYLVYDGTTPLGSGSIQYNPANDNDMTTLTNDIVTAVVADAATLGYTIAPADVLSTVGTPGPRTTSTVSLSVQTSTGAVGTQVSASRDSLVFVDLSSQTTASIAGNASVDLVLEVAPTNSATAGDWVVNGRTGNAQALSLAITLQSVQTVKGETVAYVPAGYYVKVRSTGVTGTVTTSVVEARAVLL